MKKIYLLIIAALFIFLNINAQNPPYQWAYGIGGAADESGRSIAADGLGNVYIAGLFIGTVDFDPGASVSNLISNSGSQDVFFAKYSSSGALIWAKSFGSTTSNDTVNKIIVDASLNVYLAGSFGGTTDFDPSAGVANISVPFGSIDGFFAKYDNNGNYVWAKSIGAFSTNSHQTVKSIAVDNSGSCFITGGFGAIADFDPSATTYTIATAGGHDIFIGKYDSNGNFLWTFKAGSSGSFWELGKDIKLDASGNCYVTGTYFYSSISNTPDFDPGAGSAIPPNTGNGHDVFIAKYTTAGAFVWLKCLVGNQNAGVWDVSMALDPLGNIYVTGDFDDSSSDYNPGPGVANLVSNAGSLDIFFCKYDNSGNFIWAKSIGGTLEDMSFGIYADNSGVYMTGEFRNTVDFDPGAPVVNLVGNPYGIYMSKYDVNGNYVWANKFVQTVSSPIWFFGADITGDGVSLFTTGNVFGPTGDFDTGAGVNNLTSASCCSADIYYAKYDACTAPPSSPGVISGNINVCSGSTNTYSIASVSGASSYNWTFPSGWTGTSTTNIITTTVSSTSGNVTVTANNTCGASSAQTLSVTINIAPPTPGVISGNISICSGSSNTYSVAPVAGATSYTWTKPGGWTGTSGTNAISTTASATSGNLTVTATNACGTSAAQTLSVTVNTTPATPSTISGLATMCVGASASNYSVASVAGATSYTWSLPGSWSGSSSTNIISATPGTTGIFTVTASNSCGTSSQRTLNITVNPTPTIAINSGSICAGKSFTMVPSGASTYTFQGGSAIVNPTTTTSYTVMGTSGAGCISSSSATSNVTVTATPTITVNSGAICSGNSFTMVPSGASTYTYSGGSAVVSPTITSSYNVTGTSALGCVSSNTAVASVTVNSWPTINAGTTNTLMCTGETATLTANGASTYTWSPGGAGISIVVSPTVTSTYTINGTDGNGCMNSSVFTQSVSLCTSLASGASANDISIYPNPFNNKIMIGSIITKQSIQVFNALGSIIYNGVIENESTEIDLSTQSSGIYFVRIGSVIRKIIKE